MKKLLIAILAVAVLLGACSQLDVIYKYSRESFEEIAGAFPGLVSETDDQVIITADGETLLQVSKDYSAGADDIVLATSIKPFLDAGMDVKNLGEGLSADDNTLYVTTDFGDQGGIGTAADALFAAVDAKRGALSYHSALDHYGISLSAGKFEFAKDYQTNDKDIVFVLKADVIAETGADVGSIEGWAFMTMDDGAEVLVKPYDLG